MKEKLKAIALNVVLIAVTAAVAIALGSQAPSWYKKWRGSTVNGDFTLHIADQPRKLTLYGTTTCQFCKEARAYLKKENVPFNDLLVDESPAANERYGKLGQDAVPVLVAEKQLVVGFSQDAYNQFLKSNLQKQ